MDSKSTNEERNRDVATNEGCLINPNKLKVSDKLYSILYGNCTVEYIEDDGRTYPIRVRCNSGNYMDFTLDGKSATSHIGPSLFTENPYTYAIRQMKRYESMYMNVITQNEELWRKNMNLESMVADLQFLLKQKDV